MPTLRSPRFAGNESTYRCSNSKDLNGADFSILCQNHMRRLKHGIFHSVVDLQAAINRFVREYDAENSQPLVCIADPDDIFATQNRGFQTSKSADQVK